MSLEVTPPMFEGLPPDALYIALCAASWPMFWFFFVWCFGPIED